MNCTNCGYEITSGKKFCKRCGKPTTMTTDLGSDERMLPATPKPTLESPQYTSDERALPQSPNATPANLQTVFNSQPVIQSKSALSEELKVTDSGAHTIYKGTIIERIKTSIRTGGLQTLPAGFDDKGGDWVTVHSTNLFERLYLDYQLYQQITPEIVKGNYEILSRFWQEKVDLLNRGQGKVQILSKYDPEHKSEEVIKNFPRRLKEAFDVLSKPDGIRSYFNELDRKRKEKGEDALKEIIDTALADGILEPAETQMIFDKGRNTDLSEDEQSAFLANRLKDNRFYPIGNLLGETPKSKLLSVRWATQEKYNELQRQQQPPLPLAVFQPSIPQYVDPPSAPPPQTQELSNDAHQSPKTLFLVAMGSAAVVLVVGLFVGYFYFFSSSSVETKLKDAIAKGNLIKPSGENAYEFYQQLKREGANVSIFKDMLLPKLTEFPQQLLSEVARPGSRDISVAEWEEAYKLMLWASEINTSDNSLSAKADYCTGRVAYLNNNKDEAIRLWNKAHQQYTSWALPANGIGLIYNERKDYTSAQKYLSEAINREPNWALPYNNIGTSFFQQKSYTQAEPYYQQAVNLDPTWARPHAWLGDIAMAQKDYSRAVNEYQAAINLAQPGNNMNLEKINSQLQKARQLSVSTTNTSSSSSTDNPLNILAKVKTKDGNRLILRSQPNTSANEITRIYDGSAVTIIRYMETEDFIDGNSGRWCQIKYANYEGFAWGGYLVVEKQ